MAKNHVTNFRGEKLLTPGEKIHIKDEPVTPIENDFGDHNNFDQSFEEECKGMRRSLSMNDVAALRDNFIKLGCNDIPANSRRSRRALEAPNEVTKSKYVTMAEAIYHYQRDTPGRFHTSKQSIFRSNGSLAPMGLTIPQSPMLRCKQRSRPHHILSQKEKEEIEFEEIKKFKIKANPIPKSVIEGTKNLPEVERKPPTVPEPFKLTEVQKKAVHSPGPVPKFKARPAPKHILEKPEIPVKPPVPVSNPLSPKFHCKKTKSSDQLQHLKSEVASRNGHDHQVKNLKAAVRHGPLKLQPFSFENRDKELQRRKEERIVKQIEEERRLASQFKAQPLPGAVRKLMCITTAKSSTSSASSENKENHAVRFEARPPTVLYKEPFKPVCQPIQIVRPMPFNLNTEKRAAEREQFERVLKQKEEECEKIKQQRELEQLAKEERERAQLRAKLVHHAKPVPSLAPFIPERSLAPITVPQTPTFVRRLNQH